MQSAIIVALVVVAGLIGLVIGTGLNAIADGVDDSGRTGARASRRCDHPLTSRHRLPVVSWLRRRGACPVCGRAIPARYPVVEAMTGIAFACVTWAFLSDSAAQTPAALWAGGVVAVAFLYFAAISIVLSVIDIESHRLPNAIVLPSYAVAGGLFAVAAALTDDWVPFQRGAIGMAVLFAFYLSLRILQRAGMGGGDVKLAGLIGMYLGWCGWGALIVGAFAAFLYGGVFGVVLVMLRRAGRKSAIPFGPWMLLGAWTGVLIGQAAGSWYTGLMPSAW